MFDASLFWPAFKAAGLLRLATVKQRGGAVDVWVGYAQPDQTLLSGTVRSREHEIEYQAADLPRLAEGDAVTIWADELKTAGVKFVVREEPFVQDLTGGGEDGYFRRALLTKL